MKKNSKDAQTLVKISSGVLFKVLSATKYGKFLVPIPGCSPNGTV